MSVCIGLTGQETIWVNDLFITPDLGSLYVNATTCGEFTELYAYVGNNFLQDESLDISALIVNEPELSGSVPTGRNIMTISIPPSSLGLTDLNTAVVLRFVNNANGDTEADPYDTVKAVASYASLYPCMIHNIKSITSGCNDCKALNNAIMLNLMMDITTAYFQYDRISEGIETYHQMLNLCLENEIIFQANTPGAPSPCGQYGGIGCWIVNTTFVVGQPYIV